jgi:two-component system, NarL family, sensor histidine kinase DevS
MAERDPAQHARSAEPELLVQAVELAPDGVLIVDAQGVIVYANQSVRNLVGDDLLVGSNVDRLVPTEVRQRHAALRAKYARQPSQRPMGAGLELELERADGTFVPVEISLSGAQYVIAAVRDISDRLESQRRLGAAHEQLALVAERERIGRDLHDVVLQHLYGMGLSAQAIAASLDIEPSARLEAVVDDIDRIISEVRTIVFTLGPAGRRGALGQDLADVVAQASRVLGFTPALRLIGPVDTLLSDEVRIEMVASMREALGNVARHARASQASVDVEIVDGEVVMTVTDNGVGPPPDLDRARPGHGPRPEGPGSMLRWTASY